jgi:hypothetical protein
MSGIVWLASYPKSGNTWLRVVFANLVDGGEKPVFINGRLEDGFHCADRMLFDDVVGYAASDLTADEVDMIRPDWYRRLAERAGDRILSKVHDARTALPNGDMIFPRDATAGVIYIIRNPLDMCVSYAHHRGETNFDVVIEDMADERLILSHAPFALAAQLRQRLLSWSGHVHSWTDDESVPVLVLRYEDMHAKPIETFAAAAVFAGLSADSEAIARAVGFSSFEEMQRQEQEEKFKECTAPDRPFFRKGKVGSWRTELTDAQAARIISDHADVMRRFGYLNEAGEPVY